VFALPLTTFDPPPASQEPRHSSTPTLRHPDLLHLPYFRHFGHYRHPSSRTPLTNFTMAAGRVDLESLLWEAREVLRDLSKVCGVI